MPDDREADEAQRTAAEIALRDSERLFRGLFEGTSLAVTLRDVDAGMSLIDCNRAALDLYRCKTREEFTAILPSDAAPPYQPDGRPSLLVFREVVEKCLIDGTVRVEWTSMRRDGEVFHAEVRGTIIHLEGRRVFQAVIDDISERKRSEAALAAAKEAAVEASRTKSEFLANMSHELRTPLNGIIGMVDLLSASNLDERQRRHAQVARTSAGLLLSVIDDILDFAKMETGKVAIDESAFDVAEMVEEVAAIFTAAADEKGVELRLDVAGARERLLGAPKRLRQVLANLIGNAIKFTHRGSVSVRATCHPDGDAVVLLLDVADTGIGIALDAQRLLFQPFSQIDTSNRRQFGGSGLGLAISRELVDRMGGTLGVDSDGEGHGSTFHVTLPLRRADRAAPRARTPTVRPPTPARLLLVEDSAVSAEVAGEILRGEGYRVDLVTDGVQAVEAVRGHRYDLILMDCQLPRLDGYDATRRIRELESAGQLLARARPIPIVAISANTGDAQIERCLRVGMNAHIEKPVDAARLRGMVEELLTTTQVEAAPVDLSRALARLGGNERLLERVAAQFREVSETSRAELRRVVSERDGPGAAYSAHLLRGQAATFDARELVARIETFESAAAAARWDDAATQLVGIERELERVRAALAPRAPAPQS